jgi:molybdopterin synthase catalytic subunit
VVIESGHRGEGLDAMRQFIHRLKQDVPIWKSPVWESP